MQMLRVALCITELDVGGAERCLVQLASRLDRRRFEPVVYALGMPPSGDLSCVTALKKAEIQVHFLKARRARQLMTTTRQVVRLFREHRPDVVQSFLFHANMVSRMAAHYANVRPVLCGIRVAQRGRPWRLRADRWTDRLVDRHVCVSQSVADFSHQHGGLPREKLVVIPNGIDLSAYPATAPADLSPLDIGPDRRLVTFVGRLDRQKSVDWLLRSAPAWLGPRPEWDLLLVGAGPEEARLRRLHESLAVRDRIHLLGWRSDVPALLARSQALVLPSAWEGMPNVVLEAMASSLPVVATEAEGVVELLGPDHHEQTVAHRDTDALVSKLLRLTSDPALSQRLGRQNRLRAESHFPIDRMVAAYQDLWEARG